MSGNPEWFVMLNGSRVGPVDRSNVVAMIDRAVLGRSALVWRPGLEDWTAAENVPGLFSPPPAPTGSESADVQDLTLLSTTPASEQPAASSTVDDPAETNAAASSNQATSGRFSKSSATALANVARRHWSDIEVLREIKAELDSRILTHTVHGHVLPSKVEARIDELERNSQAADVDAANNPTQQPSSWRPAVYGIGFLLIVLLGLVTNVVVWAAAISGGVGAATLDALYLAWSRTAGRPFLRAGTVGAALLLGLVGQAVLKEFNNFLAASAVAHGRSTMSR